MERVLSPRELNRATLARQLLLRRERLPVPRAVERLAGMQAQWAPAPYVGLWSRLEGFRRETLERALRRGTVLRGVLMRGTVHPVRVGLRAFGAALDVAPPGWVTPASQETAARGRPLRASPPSPGRAEIEEWLEREHGIDIRAERSLVRAPAPGAHRPLGREQPWKGPTPSFAAVDCPEIDPRGSRRAGAPLPGGVGPATRGEIGVVRHARGTSPGRWRDCEPSATSRGASSTT
jgi:hypothetical protein